MQVKDVKISELKDYVGIHEEAIASLSENHAIEAKIKDIQAEKIPDYRNTQNGRKAWQIDQNKRILELKNKLK